MKKIKRYKVEVCYLNRPFGSPIITKIKEFHTKEQADKYALKCNKNPNKFVYNRYEEGDIDYETMAL